MVTRTRGSRARRAFIGTIVLAVALTGCAQRLVREATPRIDELDLYGRDVSLLVRPNLTLVIEGVEHKLASRSRLKLLKVLHPPNQPIDTRLLWVSFRTNCTNTDCALAFLRREDGYALSLVPENVEAYRGRVREANRLHVTVGEAARTRSGKRVRLTCSEMPMLIYVPQDPPAPRCPLQ